MSSRSDEEYLADNLFGGGQYVRWTCANKKIVTVRKDHVCSGCALEEAGHIIRKGDRARLDTALMNNSEWVTQYNCLPSVDRWLDMMVTDDPCT